MVAPISGTQVRVETISGPLTAGGFAPTWVYIRRFWKRQKPPYTVDLPYTLEKQVVIAAQGGPYWYASTSSSPPWDFGLIALASNKCYEKFKSAVQDEANMAVNIAERQQAFAMMAKRVETLVTFTRRLNRLDIFGAANALKVPIPPKVRLRWLKKPYPGSTRPQWKKTPTSKDLADIWLEFHFGWEPLVKDIGSAIDLLQGDPAVKRIKVRASTDDTTNYDSGAYPPYYDYDRFRIYSRARMQIIAGIKVENPNLNLANQMGFTNPLVVAWELVPFSFVVDWFANVGQILSSYSDFLGLQILSPMSTSYLTMTKFANGFDTVYNWNYTLQAIRVERSDGIPTPVFKVNLPRAPSVTRAATAVSLLLQILHK